MNPAAQAGLERGPLPHISWRMLHPQLSFASQEVTSAHPKGYPELESSSSASSLSTTGWPSARGHVPAPGDAPGIQVMGPLDPPLPHKQGSSGPRSSWDMTRSFRQELVQSDPPRHKNTRGNLGRPC